MIFIRERLAVLKMKIAIVFWHLSYRIMPPPYNHLLSKHLDNFIQEVKEMHKGDMV